MQPNNCLQFYTIICNPKNKNDILELLSAHHAHGINIVHGHGSAKRGVLAKAFGFDTEEKKVLIRCFLPTQTAKEITALLYCEHHFDQPNTGVAFSTPVEGILF